MRSVPPRDPGCAVRRRDRSRRCGGCRLGCRRGRRRRTFPVASPFCAPGACASVLRGRDQRTGFAQAGVVAHVAGGDVRNGCRPARSGWTVVPTDWADAANATPASRLASSSRFAGAPPGFRPLLYAFCADPAPSSPPRFFVRVWGPSAARRSSRRPAPERRDFGVAGGPGLDAVVEQRLATRRRRRGARSTWNSPIRKRCLLSGARSSRARATGMRRCRARRRWRPSPDTTTGAVACPRDEAGPGRDYASRPRRGCGRLAPNTAPSAMNPANAAASCSASEREAQFARPHLAFGRGQLRRGDCAEASSDSANASTAAKQRIEVMAFPACDRNGRGRMMPRAMH